MGAVIQWIVLVLVVAGIGLGGLGWYFDDNYGNWRGPYPVVERIDLPEDYRYPAARRYNQCRYHGPGSLVVLGVEDDQVLFEYQNPAERAPWHECVRGRHFITLSRWNHLSARILDSLAECEEARRARETEAERVRRARERLNKSAGQ